jgi:hypothetical protein
MSFSAASERPGRSAGIDPTNHSRGASTAARACPRAGQSGGSHRALFRGTNPGRKGLRCRASECTADTYATCLVDRATGPECESKETAPARGRTGAPSFIVFVSSAGNRITQHQPPNGQMTIPFRVVYFVSRTWPNSTNVRNRTLAMELAIIIDGPLVSIDD